MSHGIKHSRSQKLIDFAYEYAKEALGEEHMVHSVGMAQFIASYSEDCVMISAALLSGILETSITYDDLIENGFGSDIADLVVHISKTTIKLKGE